VKKLGATILIFIYLASSAGATLNFHYCMGRLSSWGIHDHQDHKCAVCGMEKKDQDGCCRDKYKKFQVDKAHQAADFAFEIPKIVPEKSFCHSFTVPEPLALAETGVSYAAHAPPLRQPAPFFILNCVFLI